MVEGEREGEGVRLEGGRSVPALGTVSSARCDKGRSSWPDCGEGGRQWEVWLEGQVRTSSQGPYVQSFIPWALFTLRTTGIQSPFSISPLVHCPRRYLNKIFKWIKEIF